MGHFGGSSRTQTTRYPVLPQIWRSYHSVSSDWDHRTGLDCCVPLPRKARQMVHRRKLLLLLRLLKPSKSTNKLLLKKLLLKKLLLKKLLLRRLLPRRLLPRRLLPRRLLLKKLLLRRLLLRRLLPRRLLPRRLLPRRLLPRRLLLK